MIDTIILSIPKERTVMLDLTTNGVPSWNLQARTQAYEKLVKNPSARDIQSGLYFPRLTGYKRKSGKFTFETKIKIEFSAPKLLYQNNLDELMNSQFEEIVETLRDRLYRMGVVVAEQYLREAPVMAVHYSKNIELQNGYTSQYVINELGKINLNKHFDLTRARYMNDGQSLYAYAQSHSLVIYDKIADLNRGKKRSIDKEQTTYQLELFKTLTETKEILRMEVRLSQKQKMNSLFKKLGFEENPTFKDVFEIRKSKAVLSHYWNTMMSGNINILFGHSLTPKDLLQQILMANNTVKPKEAIYQAGLVLALKEGGGMRELRSILAKRATDRTWYRIATDAKKIGIALANLKPRDWYEQINDSLARFEPFHLST